jgi:energy-converting hydrogenase Eha subunit G
MRSNYSFSYIFLVFLIVSGWFLAGFVGGIVTGFGIAILFVSVVGRRIAQKAAKRIDKGVRDILVDEQ